MCRRLAELGREACRYYHRPSPGMTICYEHILMELSLLACEASSHSVEQEDEAKRRVDAALLWFSRHLEKNPNLEQLAGAVHVSCSHLRRIFHAVLQTSPKQAIDHLRFQRAKELMTNPKIKLEQVSHSCGFGSASAFSRAFRLKFRCSPETWRLYTKAPAKSDAKN